jgi:hypothetical protein
METMEWMETYFFDSGVSKPTELEVGPEVSIVSTLRSFSPGFVIDGIAAITTSLL